MKYQKFQSVGLMCRDPPMTTEEKAQKRSAECCVITALLKAKHIQADSKSVCHHILRGTVRS